MTLLCEENIVRLKVGLYGGLLFFSFFVMIAVPITTDKVGGCFLYFDIGSYGSSSNCNFAVAMAVIFQLLYGVFRLVTLLLLMLGKFNGEFVLFTDLFQLMYSAVDTVACFLVFVSACILSAGINSACSLVKTGSCSDVTFGGDSSAASRMHTAEAGAWISFILWLVMAVVGVFWLFRQGKIPFISRPAQSGDGTSGAATSPGPQMDTPPATDEPKY